MIRKLKTITGSWLEPAERRLYRLDPQPDLDNANVGMYTEQIGRCPFASLFLFCRRRILPSRILFVSSRDFPFFLFCFLFMIERQAGGTTFCRYNRIGEVPSPIRSTRYLGQLTAKPFAVRCPANARSCKHGVRLPGVSHKKTDTGADVRYPLGSNLILYTAGSKEAFRTGF